MTKKQLIKAEARYEATFEHAAVGMTHVGLDGSWLRVNQRFCDMMGYTHSELMSLKFQDVSHPDDLPADFECIRMMIHEGLRYHSMEKRYFHKDGHLVWANITIALLWITPSVPDYFIASIEDISKRKEAEIEVEELSRSLVDIQEAERQFLAMELHDQIGQQLSAIKMALSVAEAKCNDPEIKGVVEHARRIASDVIDTTKKLAKRLRPPQLDHFGLQAAVSSLVEDVGSSWGMNIVLHDGIGEQRFAPEIELACYRIIQESVSNAIQHAGSTNIDICLALTDNLLAIEVSDDGVGFLPSQVNQTLSLGMLGMRKRANTLGGKFEVVSSQKTGTVVSANFTVADI